VADALFTLLANPAEAREMGAAGRRRAETEFSPARSVAVVEAVYRTLVCES
jgi:glycosyltransferase involved in cell wall biosynthesis